MENVALVPVNPAPPVVVEAQPIDISPLNAVAIRESTLGQYLESFTTQGTWITSLQETLGLDKVSFTGLDLAYVASGALGVLTLIPIAAGTGPVVLPLVVGSTLIGIASVGMSESDRTNKIGAGIVSVGAVITNPKAVGFVLKESYNAGKETVKQTTQLANSSVGLLTAGLGLVTAVVVTLPVLLIQQQRKKREKDDGEERRKERKRKRKRSK